MSMTGAEAVIRPDEERIRIVVQRNAADRRYRFVVRASAVFVLTLMALIGTFLLLRALPALKRAGTGFVTETAWNPTGGKFGVAAILPGTIAIAFVALVLAVPMAIAGALFITEYCPRRLRSLLTSMIDLLAAVPSLIYGLWGLYFLQPRVLGLSRWLGDHLGFLPVFRVRNANNYAASAFIAGLVVAIMVVPIATAVMREVFGQAPPGEKEGALALGGTRWGVVRTVVIPFGRGGIIGGAMLGLGRALGETIAVSLIISPVFGSPWSMFRLLDNGGNSIAALIALRWTEDFNGPGLSAMMAAGLALFLLTLGVNAIAAAVVARSRSGAATEI